MVNDKERGEKEEERTARVVVVVVVVVKCPYLPDNADARMSIERLSDVLPRFSRPHILRRRNKGHELIARARNRCRARTYTTRNR